MPKGNLKIKYNETIMKSSLQNIQKKTGNISRFPKFVPFRIEEVNLSVTRMTEETSRKFPDSW
ncbi:MAG: hypothetical protein CME32_06565 [Gimesia sp.]|nr:hypothetical protein [Gimesia sp.]